MRFKRANFLYAAIMIVLLLCVSGCGEDVSDYTYSYLKPGDVPRPEYEYILDADYWLGMMGLDDLGKYDGAKESLDNLGFTSLERTNLIAFERDDFINVQCSYRVPAEMENMVADFAAIDPGASDILGRIDLDEIIGCLYFSGEKEFRDFFADAFVDPTVVKYLYDGDMSYGNQTRLETRQQNAMLEGAFLRHFTDEKLILALPNPAYEPEDSSLPFAFVAIARSKTGEPVSMEIAKFVSAMGGLLLRPLMDSFGWDELPKFERTEVMGYEGLTFAKNFGKPLVMVDAEGYFFLGGEAGVEEAISLFNMDKNANNAPGSANFYMHATFSEQVFPMLTDSFYAGLFRGFGTEETEPMWVQQALNVTNDVSLVVKRTGIPAWQDMWIKTTGDGIDINFRFHVSLDSLNIFGPGAIKQSTEEGSWEYEPTLPGAIF